MSLTPGRGSWWERTRQLPGRTPLRIKLITALLALVAIALAVISVASISVFRDTQINQASQQVSGLFEDQASELAHSHHEIPAEVIPLGIYLVAIVPAGSSLPLSTTAAVLLLSSARSRPGSGFPGSGRLAR